MTTTLFPTPAQPRFLATCMGAATFLLMSASHGQDRQAPVADGSVAGNGQQTDAPVNPQSLSCDDLKARLKTAGAMSILSGPRGGWGDTFYGPAVPRCQFWQMPQFTYVKARDRLCGVGYICVDKYPVD
jgi:hypothetical protein